MFCDSVRLQGSRALHPTHSPKLNKHSAFCCLSWDLENSGELMAGPEQLEWGKKHKEVLTPFPAEPEVQPSRFPRPECPCNQNHSEGK